MRQCFVALLLSLALFLFIPVVQAEDSSKSLLRELPRHLGGDLRESFWTPWGVSLLLGGTGATLAIHSVDQGIQEAFHPEDPLGGSKAVFNWIGTSWVLGGGAFAAFVIARLAKASKAVSVTETMLEALVLTYAITFPLKLATQRSRPDGSNNRSFPSAHASGAFAVATVTQSLTGPLYGVPSFALASLIAVARIDSNKHFASDTIAGAFLGTLIGLGAAQYHKDENPEFFVGPGMVGSSIGLTVAGRF